MMDREEHESSATQVPLVALAKSNGEQFRMNHVHRDHDIGEQDILRSNKDEQVNTKAARGSVAPPEVNLEGSTKARSKVAKRFLAH
ncbi:hypothetical protein ACFX1Q_023696 [Malus domestica]